MPSSAREWPITDRTMPLLNPRQKSQGGTFTQVGDEPLSKQVLGVRLPESVYDAVRNLPNRTEWLRRVISEAAQRELMNGELMDESMDE